MTKSPSWFLYCERIAVVAWTEHERTHECGGKAKGNITTTLSVLEGVMRRLLNGQALTPDQRKNILKWIRPDWYLGRGVSKAALTWTDEVKLSDRQLRLTHRNVRDQGLDPTNYRLNAETIEILRLLCGTISRKMNAARAADVTSSSGECQVIVTPLSGDCQADVNSLSGQCQQQSLQPLTVPHSSEHLYNTREEKKREEQTSGMVTSSPAQPSASPTLAAVPLAGLSVGSPLMASPLSWGVEVTSAISGEMEGAMPSASGNAPGEMVARSARQHQPVTESEIADQLARQVLQAGDAGGELHVDPYQLGSKITGHHPVFDHDPNLRAMKAELETALATEPTPGWNHDIEKVRVALWIGDDVRGAITINSNDVRNFVLSTWDGFADKMARHFPESEDRAWRRILDEQVGHVYRKDMLATKAGLRPVELFYAWSPLYAKNDRDGDHGPCEPRMGLWVLWEGDQPTTAILFNGLHRITIELTASTSNAANAPDYVGTTHTATARPLQTVAAA